MEVPFAFTAFLEVLTWAGCTVHFGSVCSLQSEYMLCTLCGVWYVFMHQAFCFGYCASCISTLCSEYYVSCTMPHKLSFMPGSSYIAYMMHHALRIIHECIMLHVFIQSCDSGVHPVMWCVFIMLRHVWCVLCIIHDAGCFLVHDGVVLYHKPAVTTRCTVRVSAYASSGMSKRGTRGSYAMCSHCWHSISIIVFLRWWTIFLQRMATSGL